MSSVKQFFNDFPTEVVIKATDHFDYTSRYQVPSNVGTVIVESNPDATTPAFISILPRTDELNVHVTSETTCKIYGEPSLNVKWNDSSPLQIDDTNAGPYVNTLYDGKRNDIYTKDYENTYKIFPTVKTYFDTITSQTIEEIYLTINPNFRSFDDIADYFTQAFLNSHEFQQTTQFWYDDGTEIRVDYSTPIIYTTKGIHRSYQKIILEDINYYDTFYILFGRLYYNNNFEVVTDTSTGNIFNFYKKIDGTTVFVSTGSFQAHNFTSYGMYSFTCIDSSTVVVEGINPVDFLTKNFWKEVKTTATKYKLYINPKERFGTVTGTPNFYVYNVRKIALDTRDTTASTVYLPKPKKSHPNFNRTSQFLELVAYDEYEILDAYGTFNSHPVTFTCADPTVLINGSATQVLNTNFMHAKFIWTGNRNIGWRMITS